MNDVDKILGTSAPPAKPAARRSSSRRTAAAATPDAETPPDAPPTRKRRAMFRRREEGGVRADDRLLGQAQKGRAQKDSREVTRRPAGWRVCAAA